MFSVTGSLLVKPRVSIRPSGENKTARPTSHSQSLDFVSCGCQTECCLSFTLQLLEDVEETLSCTTFEEDSLYRKLNCERSFMNTLLYDSLMSRFKAD